MCFFVLWLEPVTMVNTKVLKVLLLLGSNSEDAIKVLAQAGLLLSAKTPILRAGSLWRTAAWGFEGPDFVNQVLEVEWTGEPLALLEFCLETERLLGRVRSADAPRYESRRIDIDLLLASPFLNFSAGLCSSPLRSIGATGLPTIQADR